MSLAQNLAPIDWASANCKFVAIFSGFLTLPLNAFENTRNHYYYLRGSSQMMTATMEGGSQFLNR